MKNFEKEMSFRKRFKAYYADKAAPMSAVRWLRNGDHPLDGEDGEGKVVRYFRRPDVHGADRCSVCDTQYHGHGWMDKEDIVVCPGDWVITEGDDATGERYALRNTWFREITG